MRTERPIVRRDAAVGSQLPANLHPVLKRVYANRGVRDPDDLNLELAGLIPVGCLGGIERAVELVLAHRRRRILIVGDFDADGATSTALVIRCLRRFGFAEVDYLVPNRFEFGYGLSAALAAVAIELAPSLIITVDNGISSVAGIRLCVQAGIDVLVTDHHLPPDELPAATAILNPNLRDDSFPSKALAGVGVAFCLMAALGRRLERDGEVHSAVVAADYLDLVALGTVADVVALDRNNRILIEQGLRRIRAGRTIAAIPALLADAGRDFRRAVASDLAYIVGPRLNAAGRLKDMSIGIAALLSDSREEAAAAALRLSSINRERREIEAGMIEQALAALERMPGPGAEPLTRCLTLYDASWHQGVVGLIASRIKERTHRPVFAFALAGDAQLKGSGRSVPGVHLRDVLVWIDSRVPGLMHRFGGHSMAAGLSLPRENLEAFSAHAIEACEALFPDAGLAGQWLSDGELDAGSLDIELAETLRSAGPWGQSFSEPLFDGRFIAEHSRVVGVSHLKLRVRPESGGASLDAIAFGCAEVAPLPAGASLELVYRLDVNEYRGIRSAQLVVEQIRVL